MGIRNIPPYGTRVREIWRGVSDACPRELRCEASIPSTSILKLKKLKLNSLQAVYKENKVERSYLGKSYITKPLVMTQGEIIVKDNFNGPGLGIQLDEHLIDNERGIPEWEFPEMWDEDGAVHDH